MLKWGKIITKQYVWPLCGLTQWNLTPVKTCPCFGVLHRPGAGMGFESEMTSHRRKRIICIVLECALPNQSSAYVTPYRGFFLAYNFHHIKVPFLLRVYSYRDWVKMHSYTKQGTLVLFLMHLEEIEIGTERMGTGDSYSQIYRSQPPTLSTESSRSSWLLCVAIIFWPLPSLVIFSCYHSMLLWLPEYSSSFLSMPTSFFQTSVHAHLLVLNWTHLSVCEFLFYEFYQLNIRNDCKWQLNPGWVGQTLFLLRLHVEQRVMVTYTMLILY